MFRSKAERKVAEAGYDPARLPPGQYYTAKWPVLHAGSVARYDDLTTWTLRVFGEVEEEVELSFEQLNALPRTSNTQDIHCVTRWSRFDAPVRRSPLARAREARPPEADGALCDRACGGRVHRQRAARLARGRRGPPRDARRRRAADTRPRLSDCGSSSPASTSGRAPSGCGGSSSRRSTSPGSGSATATTTTPTRGPRSATASRDESLATRDEATGRSRSIT